MHYVLYSPTCLVFVILVSIQDSFHCKQGSLYETPLYYRNKGEVENIEAHISYHMSQELVLYKLHNECAMRFHYQPAILEKYHSFIVFDIVACALITMQTAKCSSYFPHIMSESYIIMIVPTCIRLIHDTFLYSFVIW